MYVKPSPFRECTGTFLKWAVKLRCILNPVQPVRFMRRLTAVPVLMLIAASIPATVSPAAAANSGLIVTIAGNGTAGYGGDGGPATAASFYNPVDVVVDSSGNVFVVDATNNRVRKLSAATGIITTVAGNGVDGFSGDGGPATSASLSYPSALALDSAGDLFIADVNNGRVRRVDAVTGAITTVAGNGSFGYGGDGGPATSATLTYPFGLAVDVAGNLFLADQGNERIRRVDAATGIIRTVAGNGNFGYGGDGGGATAATLAAPTGLALDNAGNLFIADQGNGSIRRVDAGSGIITTVAGVGSPTVWPNYSPDGGVATATSLYYPTDVALDVAGNIFITEPGSNRVRRVDTVTKILTTSAGSGACCFSGDGGPAVSAALNSPVGVAVDGAGNLFIADQMNQRIRRVTPQPTTTSISCNANYAPYGQQLAITATVSPSQATGTVQFFDYGAALGATALSGGSASVATSALAVGIHSLTAVYGGDPVYFGSAPPASIVTVIKAATTAYLSSNLNPSRLGQTVTFTANVSPASATGSFQYFDGAASLGVVAAIGGAASIATSGLGVGSHSITAVYSGDGNYNGSTSAAWAQSVISTATSTAVVSSNNPSVYGQPVRFTATVSPGTATGTVDFLDGTLLLQSLPLSAGTATFGTSALGAGSHSVTARYDGDRYDSASASPVAIQTVNKAVSSAGLVSSANPAVLGKPVTFTATVAPGSATGTVQFFDGAKSLGSSSLVNGAASLTTSALSMGSHSVTVRYGGDANYTGTTSAVLTETIKKKL